MPSSSATHRPPPKRLLPRRECKLKYFCPSQVKFLGELGLMPKKPQRKLPVKPTPRRPRAEKIIITPDINIVVDGFVYQVVGNAEYKIQNTNTKYKPGVAVNKSTEVGSPQSKLAEDDSEDRRGDVLLCPVTGRFIGPDGMFVDEPELEQESATPASVQVAQEDNVATAVLLCPVTGRFIGPDGMFVDEPELEQESVTPASVQVAQEDNVATAGVTVNQNAEVGSPESKLVEDDSEDLRGDVLLCPVTERFIGPDGMSVDEPELEPAPPASVQVPVEDDAATAGVTVNQSTEVGSPESKLAEDDSEDRRGDVLLCPVPGRFIGPDGMAVDEPELEPAPPASVQVAVEVDAATAVLTKEEKKRLKNKKKLKKRRVKEALAKLALIEEQKTRDGEAAHQEDVPLPAAHLHSNSDLSE